MIDLKNAWILNVNGELKNLWVAMTKEQGINPRSEDTLTTQAGRFLSIKRGMIWCIAPNSEQKQITLADLKPKQAVEGDYDKGMRGAMKKIAMLVGIKSGVDVGYDDLPSKVDAIISGLTSTIEMLSPDEPKPKRGNVSYEKVLKTNTSLDELMQSLIDGEKFYDGEHCGGHYPRETVLRKFLSDSMSLFRKVEVEFKTEVRWIAYNSKANIVSSIQCKTKDECYNTLQGNKFRDEFQYLEVEVEVLV